MTQGTPREWKVLYNLDNMLHCPVVSWVVNKPFKAVWTMFSLFRWCFPLADVTYNFDQVINTNSPESCWTYLMNLEKRGNPHTDVNLLNKLKDCYSKIFSRLPIRQFSKNISYARILVRYAELKGWVWMRILYLNYSLGNLWCVLGQGQRFFFFI